MVGDVWNATRSTTGGKDSIIVKVSGIYCMSETHSISNKDD